MSFGIEPNFHIQTNDYSFMSDSCPTKSQHPNVQGTDTVSQTAGQTDQQTDRQVVGIGCGGSQGEGPTWALLTCPHPLFASPLLSAREQMGCTACPSVHQSDCTKQHTPQAATPTSVSRTASYQTRTTPPTQPQHTHTHQCWKVLRTVLSNSSKHGARFTYILWKSRWETTLTKHKKANKQTDANTFLTCEVCVSLYFSVEVLKPSLKMVLVKITVCTMIVWNKY